MVRKLGIPPENLDPTRYAGPRFNVVPVTEAKRAPTVLDRNYPLFTLWRVQAISIDGSTEGSIYYLARFADSGDPTFNPGDAVWLKFSTVSGVVTSLRTDDNVIVNPLVGTIDVDGVIVPNATNAQPLFTDGSVSNTAQFELQVGAAVTATPADTNDAGIVSFDDTQFTVDANGFVQLAGGGLAIDQIDVDFNTAPGTDPVLPTAAGQVRISGNTVINATNLNAPVATHSRAANALNVEVQLSTALAPTPADPFDVGLSSFDDTAFTVDGNGFVQLIGGGASPAVLSFAIDTNTGPGTNPVVADGTGQVTILGDTVANATNAAPVYTHSRAANAYNIEVQVAADRTGAPGDKLDAGLCSFDDTAFTVDSDGYVELLGGGPMNPLARLFDFDDFLGYGVPSTAGMGYPKLAWRGNGLDLPNPSTITTESGHPGIIRLRAQTAAPTAAYLVQSNSSGSGGGLILGGGILTITWIMKLVQLSDATNRFTARIGLGLFDGLPPTDGLYFEYADNVNSGNWQIISRAASTSTTGNTGTAATTDWTKFEIEINAAASSVEYRIDGVAVTGSPLTTNIPTAKNLGGYFSMNKTVTDNSFTDIYADLFIVDYQLTTSRA